MIKYSRTKDSFIDSAEKLILKVKKRKSSKLKSLNIVKIKKRVLKTKRQFLSDYVKLLIDQMLIIPIKWALNLKT